MLVGKGDPIRSATDVRILYAYTYRIANSFQIISAWPVIWERIPEGIPGMGSGGGVSYYYTDVRRDYVEVDPFNQGPVKIAFLPKEVACDDESSILR
jgi:hypothetical protein